VKQIRNSADQGTALAGFVSFAEERDKRVLEKGTGPQGMKHEDAKAIIAYLKSLPRGAQ
jgi:hypothetical protein